MRGVIDQSAVEDPAVQSPHTSETLVTLIRAFLIDAPDQVELVMKAVSDRDYARVVEGALTLKGSAGDLGALELHATCEQLHSAGQRGEQSGLQNLGPTLRRDFETAYGVLEDLLESYG